MDALVDILPSIDRHFWQEAKKEGHDPCSHGCAGYEPARERYEADQACAKGQALAPTKTKKSNSSATPCTFARRAQHLLT